jgi:hypothetical protein
MAETPIVSNSLQTTFRSNFPSQVSSGRDLHVSDVIVPIVDFSSTAGTTGLSVSLQQALSFGNQTSFDIDSATTTIISNTGFFRVFGTIYLSREDPPTSEGRILISDGSTDKLLFGLDNDHHSSTTASDSVAFDFICFVTSGDSVKGLASGQGRILVTTRQVADLSGVLVNPTGYTGE